MEIKCLAGSSERMELQNRPFKGFIFNIFSELDVPTTVLDPWTFEENAIDLNKVRFILTNLDTDKDVINEPLARLWHFINRHKTGATAALYAGLGMTHTVPEGAAHSHAMMTLHIELPTYDGNYQLTIEMNDSVKAGTKAGSYISVITDWSDEAMLFETYIGSLAWDRVNIDTYLGDAIEEVAIVPTLQNVTDPADLGGIYYGMLNKIERVSYASQFRQEQYTRNGLDAVTRVLLEEPLLSVTVRNAVLTVHDEEVNNNFQFMMESTSLPDQTTHIMYSRFRGHPNAQNSAARADNRWDVTVGKVDLDNHK